MNFIIIYYRLLILHFLHLHFFIYYWHILLQTDFVL